MDIIFPQLLIMYNNLLYFYAKSYVNNWTYENQMNLEKLFGLNGSANSNIQLSILQDINKEAIKHSIRLDAMTQKVKEINKVSTVDTKQIEKYRNMIRNLTEQKSTLEIQPPTGQLTQQIDILKEKIQILDDKITTMIGQQGPNNTKSGNLNTLINGEVDRINNGINTRMTEFVISKDLLGIGTTNTYDNIFNHVSDIYNNVFIKVVNNPDKTVPVIRGYKDYFLYNSLWKSVINDNDGGKLRNISNIHLMSSQMQNTLIEKMKIIKSAQNINDINKDLDILIQLHNNIFDPTINNMFDLSQTYKSEENYVLTEVIDIIVHITKHILCANLYYAIVKILMKYLLTINPKDMSDLYDPQKNEYSVFIVKLTDEILNSIKLHNFILKEMPKSLVKLKLKIYENDFDKDRNIKSIDYYFGNIVNIITDNKVFTIPKNSSFVTNLENYIFKYYKDIFDLIIPRMKTLIDNYSRFILNETRFLNVSKLFNMAIVKEL